MIDVYGTEKDRGLAAGYFWSFGATAIPLASAFITSLIIARWLGPRVVGLISWTMAVATLFLVVGKFGVEGASSRLISEYRISAPGRIRALVRSGFLLRMSFTLLAALVMVLLAPVMAGLFGEPALQPLMRIGGLIVLSVSLNELAALMILGLKRFRMLFLMRMGMFLLRVGLVAAAIAVSLRAGGVLAAYVGSALIPGLVILVLLLRIRGRRDEGSGLKPELHKLIRLSVPLAVSGASVTIYSLLDKIMLGYFTGASQVGLYSMARNVLETSLFPTFALIMTLRPALAQSFSGNDMERCRDLINQSVRNSMVYSFCVMAVFMCLAEPLITGLFGDEFVYSAVLLTLFLPLILMRSVGSVILPGLIAANRAKVYALLTLAGAVVNFIMNILLIPAWGSRGAVAATLISYIPIAFIGMWELSRVFRNYWGKRELIDLVKTVFISALLVSIYLNFVTPPGKLIYTVIHAAILVILFTVMSLLMRVITWNDLKRYIKPLTGGFRRRGGNSRGG